MSPSRKLRLYLDLNWMTGRLAHEYAVSSGALRQLGDGADEFWARHISAGSRVLDLGCGPGHKHRRLKELGADVTGVDTDKAAIAEARRQNPQFRYHVQAAGDFLASNAQTFDTLFLSHFLEHVDDPSVFLSLCRLHFSWLFIEVPDFEVTHLNPLRPFVGTTRVYTDSDHVSEFDRRELSSTIENAGYRVAEAEYRFGLIRFWCQPKEVPPG